MPSFSLKALSLSLAALACLPLGSIANAARVEWVTVGDPWSTADTAPSGFGYVATSFRIMKYELTNQQEQGEHRSPCGLPI